MIILNHYCKIFLHKLIQILLSPKLKTKPKKFKNNPPYLLSTDSIEFSKIKLSKLDLSLCGSEKDYNMSLCDRSIFKLYFNKFSKTFLLFANLL